MKAMPTRIKHCGITTVEDAHLAAEAGAWALGMIFWARSPRRCDLDEAQQIGTALRRTVHLTGVFVNARLEEIDLAVATAGLDFVQLHGDEGPMFCSEVARSRASLQAAAAYHTDFLLLDAHVEGVPGGTGQTIDWTLVRQARLSAPVILSGGLDADNVATAIAVADPFAVDVASGTESAPGVKDPAKLRAFHEAVRGTSVPAAS
jgi:phosphoribosylanthranilate isomerase